MMQLAERERWLAPATAGLQPQEVNSYRAAFMAECALNFRSVRAGFQYAEESIFTAWYPLADLPIDWGSPAVDVPSVDATSESPTDGFVRPSLNLIVSDSQFQSFQDELVDYLSRRRRFGALQNKEFGLYSAPGETRENFLNRVAEKAIDRLEPEIKNLLEYFERKIEQLRERYEGPGRRLVVEDPEEHLTQLRTMFLTSETRLAEMFLSRFRLVVNHPDPREEEAGDREVLDDLNRIEEEAKATLNERYTEYLRQIADCDLFEIGLQPEHIRVLRRGLLWVPRP